MATTYTIRLENNYGSDHTYGIFNSPPELSVTGKSPPFTNVWMSTALADGADDEIEVTTTYFAFCGTPEKEVAPGVSVTSGQRKMVTLGTSNLFGDTWHTKVASDGKPRFYRKEGDEKSARVGAYAIATDTRPAASTKPYLIGLAATTNMGTTEPTATFYADWGIRYNITPVARYQISVCEQAAGKVVDYTAISENCADIDFTANPGMLYASVFHQPDGKFSIDYFPNFTMYKLFRSARSPTRAAVNGYFKDIKKQLANIERLLITVPALPGPFFASLNRAGNPTEHQTSAVLEHMRAAMVDGSGVADFARLGRERNGALVVSFRSDRTEAQIVAAWAAAFANLDEGLQGLYEAPDAAQMPGGSAGPAKSKKLLQSALRNGSANGFET